jgi:hypothetical protein
LGNAGEIKMMNNDIEKCKSIVLEWVNSEGMEYEALEQCSHIKFPVFADAEIGWREYYSFFFRHATRGHYVVDINDNLIIRCRYRLCDI